MSFQPQTPVTGEFGLVQLINSVGASFAATPMTACTVLPLVNNFFPTGQLFQITDRTKKVLDPALQPSQVNVYNNGVLVNPATYRLLGGGYVYFPIPITPAGGTADIQTITLANTPTGGTFTLTWKGFTTTPIAFNATGPIGVQAALRALFPIGAAGVTVTGPASGPYIVTFAGPLATGAQPAISGNGALLTGAGVQPTATGALTTPGTASVTMDGGALSTAAANLYILPETSDWKYTNTAANVKNQVYGLDFGRIFPTQGEGQLTFMQNDVDETIAFFLSVNQLITLALYVSTNTVTPRIRVVSGYVLDSPQDNSIAAMASGTKTVGLIRRPYYLNENL
jgi:hypothetical protein